MAGFAGAYGITLPASYAQPPEYLGQLECADAASYALIPLDDQLSVLATPHSIPQLTGRFHIPGTLGKKQARRQQIDSSSEDDGRLRKRQQPFALNFYDGHVEKWATASATSLGGDWVSRRVNPGGDGTLLIGCFKTYIDSSSTECREQMIMLLSALREVSRKHTLLRPKDKKFISHLTPWVRERAHVALNDG